MGLRILRFVFFFLILEKFFWSSDKEGYFFWKFFIVYILDVDIDCVGWEFGCGGM